MFNWFISPKNKQNQPIDTENEGQKMKNSQALEFSEIPKSPAIDRELIAKLKKEEYDPCHYYLPEDLKTEITEAFRIKNVKTDDKIKELMESVNIFVQESEEYARKALERYQNEQSWNSSESSDSEIVSPCSKKFRRSLSETFDSKRKNRPRYRSVSYENPFYEDPDMPALVNSENSEEFLDEVIDSSTTPLEEVVVENEITTEREITAEDIDRISQSIGEWCEDRENKEERGNCSANNVTQIDYDAYEKMYQEVVEEMEQVEVEKVEAVEQEVVEEQVEQEIIPNPSYNPLYDPSHNQKLSYKSEKKISPEHPEGYLEIYLGPMFSGKSTKIFFKLTSRADQRFRCLYVNSLKDERETESNDKFVSTHNSSYSRPSPKVDCVKVSSLSEVDVQDYDYIAVDELQFFDDAYTHIIDWVTMSGKYVMVASLDGDCYRRKFGNVLDLIPHANEVHKLTAYCDICRDNYGDLTPAPFTARMTSDTTAELVGGCELYKAMCRKCHDFHLDVTLSFV